MLAVHVTHEAQRKYGGIGAVLDGLIPAAAYGRLFDQTLVYGPLFEHSGPLACRLSGQGELLYSGLDGFDQGGWAERLRPLEERTGVRLVLGRRSICDPLCQDKRRCVEVVLADVRSIEPRLADQIKFILWQNFGLDSRPFTDWDYEQYLRLAVPYLDLLEALYPGQRTVHLAHEYMGLPVGLAVVAAQRTGLRRGDLAFFYAHEVSPARAVVEKHPGHEVSFDRLVELGLRDGRRLEEDFGPLTYDRAELVRRAGHLDGVLAVSDNVRDQLLYFQPAVERERIEVVYNGVAFDPLSPEEILASRRLVQDYCRRLLNFTPDLIFTHMSRLVVSKGLWRDLKLLFRLDDRLAEQGRTGFFLLLSSLIASGRTGEDVRRMESDYGWPVLHRSGWPDLVGDEQAMADFLAVFNAKSKAIKGVFLNQFGFSPEACGLRLPQGADLLTLRAASEAELGLSIYEPFGIAQLETYAYGGLPIISRACGCSYLLEEVAPAGTFQVIDFARPNGVAGLDLTDRATLLAMTATQREAIEEAATDLAAPTLAKLLLGGRSQGRMKKMLAAAERLSWEAIAERVVAAVEKRAG